MALGRSYLLVHALASLWDRKTVLWIKTGLLLFLHSGEWELDPHGTAKRSSSVEKKWWCIPWVDTASLLDPLQVSSLAWDGDSAGYPHGWPLRHLDGRGSTLLFLPALLAAFNTVDYNLLTHCFADAGIVGAALQCPVSFLHGQKQGCNLPWTWKHVEGQAAGWGSQCVGVCTLQRIHSIHIPPQNIFQGAYCLGHYNLGFVNPILTRLGGHESL